MSQTSTEIRPLKTFDEFKEVEELQVEVWGCSEREVLPSLALIPLLEIGGVLLGAFANQTLVGFVLGFPGFHKGERILHSDMLAVKAAYRSTGLGYELKLAQREAALENGVERITWTFDPLQAGNAHLNFAKLGVIADRYKLNYYGTTSSLLHRTGTDRLWVTWLLNSERVTRRLAKPQSEAQDAFLFVALGEHGEPVLAGFDKAQPALAIQIPSDINSIAQNDPARALRWREATRNAFQQALAANYVVSDFFRGSGEQHGAYYLIRAN